MRTEGQRTKPPVKPEPKIKHKCPSDGSWQAGASAFERQARKFAEMLGVSRKRSHFQTHFART